LKRIMIVLKRVLLVLVVAFIPFLVWMIYYIFRVGLKPDDVVAAMWFGIEFLFFLGVQQVWFLIVLTAYILSLAVKRPS
jgi:hypothetical protein